VLFVPKVHGHHLWVVESDNGYRIARGKAPERLDAYNPECVKEFVAFSMNGELIPADNIERVDMPEEVRFRTSNKASLVGVSCDWGYRVNTTKGKKFLTRQEAEEVGLNVINSFFSTQYAKVLFSESGWSKQPMGMKFELVPLANPLKMPDGGELPIQVLFDQTPLPDTAVFTIKGDKLTTGDEGIVRVKLEKPGLQLFMAKHKVWVKDHPEKDYHVYRAFFVFEVK
jgi:uncharacterized GH25 family protein